MMRKRIFSFTVIAGTAAMMLISFIVGVAANVEASVPVRLTVLDTNQKISVSLPASLPISVINGDIQTAESAEIRNTAEFGAVKVVSVDIQDAAYTVGDYDLFEDEGNSIALTINDIGTEGEGLLDINEQSFPVIKAGAEIPVDYDAKVSSIDEVDGVTAANVTFVVASVLNGG